MYLKTWGLASVCVSTGLPGPSASDVNPPSVHPSHGHGHPPCGDYHHQLQFTDEQRQRFPWGSEGKGGGGGGYYGGEAVLIDGEHTDSGGAGGSGYIGNPLLTNKVMYCYNCEESTEESTKTISTTNVSETPISKYAKKGNRLGDICHAIGEYVHSQGYSVVREFQGHGIGREMHEDPGIPNYGKAGRGIRLEPGMTLAIEPMVIQGKPNILELDDGWTIITEDGSMAAHYENTILITEKEPEILTILKK